MVNAEDVLGHMMNRLRRRVVSCPSDDEAQQLLKEALSLGGPDLHVSPLLIQESPELIMPLHLKREDFEIRCFTVVTTLATVSDVTLQELQIETYFPADEQSEQLIRSLGARPGAPDGQPGLMRRPRYRRLLVIKIRPPTLFVDSDAWIQVTAPRSAL